VQLIETPGDEAPEGLEFVGINESPIMRCGDSQFAMLVPGLEDIENAKRFAHSLIERLEASN